MASQQCSDSKGVVSISINMQFVFTVQFSVPFFCLFCICAFHGCALPFLLQNKGKIFVIHKEVEFAFHSGPKASD